MFSSISKDEIENFKSNFKLKQIGEVQEIELNFYDTYFNALLQSGFYLVEFQNGIWLKKLNGDIIDKLSNISTFNFYWDLPDSKLRDILEEKIGYFALVKKSTIKNLQSNFMIQNDDEKGICRVYILEIFDKFLIQVEPIKGYENYSLELLEYLKNCEKISDIFDLVKPVVNIREKIVLSPKISSKDAIKVLFIELFYSLKEQEIGIIKHIDSEFLHFYRVSLRKFRSLLSLMKSVFDKNEITYLKEFLSKIAKNTNHARDLDVYWLKVREYQESLNSVEFIPFLEFLEQESKKEYKKLNQFFTSSEYEKFFKYLHKFIESDFGHGKNSQGPIITLVKKRVKKQYKKLLNDGELINRDSEDCMLHALRIDCKKLRYLMEFFESLFEKELITQAIKLIKNIQTILGNFQDLSVQQQKIVHFADEMVKESKHIQTRPLISIGKLVSDLEREQKSYKELFLSSFEEFKKLQNREIFEKLFEEI